MSWIWGYTVSIGNAVNNSEDGFEALGIIYIPEIHYNLYCYIYVIYIIYMNICVKSKVVVSKQLTWFDVSEFFFPG